MDLKTICLLLLPCFANSQTIALVDREFKRPMALTATPTAAQLSGNLFPVYTDDLDSVILLTEHLLRYIDTSAVRAPEMQLLSTGHSRFAVTTDRSGAYNTYCIFFSTHCGALGASMELAKQGSGPKKAAHQIGLLLAYLKNNRHHMAVQK